MSSYSSLLSLSPGEYQCHQAAGFAAAGEDDDMAVAAAAVSSYLSFDMDFVGEYYPPETDFHSNQETTLLLHGGDGRKNGERREHSHGKIDNGAAPASGGAGALPRSKNDGKIAFKTRSEVDVLDDGYRWRKYGKKMVKNSPNPRNYYRCSADGCRVKKRVERARDDARFVVTTYDGVHNHPAPPHPRPAAGYSIAGPAAGHRLLGLKEEEAAAIALFRSTSATSLHLP